MNKIKLALSAVAVFCIVGGALAAKARINPDLRICNAAKICVAPSQPFSSVAGTPTINPGNLYTGALNSSCATATSPCKLVPQTQQVFLNN